MSLWRQVMQRIFELAREVDRRQASRSTPIQYVLVRTKHGPLTCSRDILHGIPSCLWALPILAACFRDELSIALSSLIFSPPLHTTRIA